MWCFPSCSLLSLMRDDAPSTSGFQAQTPFLPCLRLPYNLNSSNSYMRRQAQEWRELQYQQIMIWWVAKMDPKSWRELEKSTTPRTEVENGEVVLSQRCSLVARSRCQAARGDARRCCGAEKAILGNECWRGGSEGLGRPRGNG